MSKVTSCKLEIENLRMKKLCVKLPINDNIDLESDFVILFFIAYFCN